MTPIILGNTPNGNISRHLAWSFRDCIYTGQSNDNRKKEV